MGLLITEFGEPLAEAVGFLVEGEAFVDDESFVSFFVANVVVVDEFCFVSFLLFSHPDEAFAEGST